MKRILILLVSLFICSAGNAQDCYRAIYKSVNTVDINNYKFPEGLSQDQKMNLIKEMKKVNYVVSYNYGNIVTINPQTSGPEESDFNLPVTLIDVHDSTIYQYFHGDSAYIIGARNKMNFVQDSTNIVYNGMRINSAFLKSADIRIWYKPESPYLMPMYSGNIYGTIYKYCYGNSFCFELQKIQKYDNCEIPDLTKFTKLTKEEWKEVKLRRMPRHR